MDGWMDEWMDDTIYGQMDRLSRYARMHLKIIISDEPKIQELKILIQIQRNPIIRHPPIRKIRL